MNKSGYLLISMIILLMVPVTMSATDYLKKAKSMMGKPGQLKEARALLDSAKRDSALKADVYTYYLGGKLELEAYKKGRKQLMVNPSASVDKTTLADNLNFLVRNWQEALRIDTLKDKKGRIKPRYTKEIKKELGGLQEEIFAMGTYFYNEKKYWPEEYDVFKTYLTLAETGIEVPDSMLPKAALNAGLAAYQTKHYPEASEAFRQVREMGDDRREIYTYEIASLREMVMRDSMAADSLQERIARLSLEAYDKYGEEYPFFLRNYVSLKLLSDDLQAAMTTLEARRNGKRGADIYQLTAALARLYDRAGLRDKASDAYKEAAEDSKAEADVLSSGARLLYSVGQEKWGVLEGSSASVEEERSRIKEQYFVPALNMASRVKDSGEGDSDIDVLIENITYVIQTGF